jgi:hypothetical protein
MWADDCVVFSLSQAGLQHSINLTVKFFSDLDLSVNVKKTKVMIFNPRGLGPKFFPNLTFFANNAILETCDQYTYLGLVFKPSGSTNPAQQELLAKCSRAWFSMSNIFYENKKMQIKRSLQLLDSVVMPVGLFSAEFLTILSLPERSLHDLNSLLTSWENFPLEK